jgi:hypothetical protein
MFWRSRIRLWTTVRLAYSVLVIQAGYYNKLRPHPSTQFRFSFTVIIPTRSYITYAAETASLNKQRYKIFYCTGSISHLWSVSRHRFMDSFQPLCFDLLRRIRSCFRHVSSSLFLRALHCTALQYFIHYPLLNVLFRSRFHLNIHVSKIIFLLFSILTSFLLACYTASLLHSVR